MQDVLHVFLGALLVSIGVIASAAADRIRGIRDIRPQQRGERAPAPAPAREPTPRARPIAVVDSTPEGSGDVVAALVAAGFKKNLAAQAVAACTTREQATPESWAAAALRRCAQGGAS